MKGVFTVHSSAAVGLPNLAGTSAGALIPVANRPIIAHAIERLRAAGVRDVAVVAATEHDGPVRHALLRAGLGEVPIFHPEGGASPGPLSALVASRSWLGGESVILQRADGLMDLAELSIALTAAAEASSVGVLVQRRRSDGPVDLVTQRLIRLADSTPVDADDLEAAGALVFGGAAARRAGALDLLDLADLLERLGGPLQLQVINGWRGFAGDAHDLLELNRAVLETLEGSLPEGALGPGVRIQGRVHVHPSARLESSIVRGPVVIGAGATISDAYVGPYTAIGDGVRVEGAEVEHSVIFDRASILHIGRRLEGSVVGSEARIVREFSMPSGLRLAVGDRTEVALC